MASPSSNPFYGSAAGNSPANSGYQRLALDNLIRRELKVGDPNDPQQIANALLERFKDDPRTKAISQEAEGLPFLQAMPTVNPLMQTASSSDAELQQAKDDVGRDLQELLSNSLLKDVTPEIQGWAQAVRSAIQEGTMAARFALDTRQRDKVFAIRHKLSDYARMARLVGALTPMLNLTYRRFAQSLDEVASLLLVMMGENLASAGFSGGRFLLQVPYSELQQRRDSVIAALRNFVGSTQQAYSPNEYQRGLHAYRELIGRLEEAGQGDLRILLNEYELSRLMDELIQRAQHGRVEGLRALGATAQLDLQQIRRLIIVGQKLLNLGLRGTDSPEFIAFLDALLMFAEGFDSAGGFRLLRIARPPILFYGLYGIGGQAKADRRLLDLVIERGALAEKLDCFLMCDCEPNQVQCQIILDKVLYDIDRAIDLYALGHDDLGEPELRAAATSLVIDQVLEWPVDSTKCSGLNPDNWPKSILVRLSWLLRPCSSVTKGVGDVWQCDATPAQGEMWEKTSTTEWVDMLHESADPSQQSRWKLDYLMQELCVQRQMETRWQNLVETMAPRCFGEFSAIENQILRLLTKAAGELNFKGLDQECQLSVRVPPSRDFSQDVVADILRRQERKQMTIFAERVNVAADSPPGDSATRTVSAKVPPKKD